MTLKSQVYSFAGGVQDDILQLIVRNAIFADAAKRWIKPGYFTGEHRRAVAEVLIKFYTEYSIVPTVSQLVTELKRIYPSDHTIWIELQNLIKYLYNPNIKPINEKYTIKLVADFAQTQAWRQAIADALPLLQRGEHDKVNAIMKKAADIKYSLDAGGYWYFETFEERVTRRADEDQIAEDIIPTGILEVDARIRNGGPAKGEIGLWIAPTNGGKSIALAQMARRAVWANENVAIFTLEMSTEKYADRLDAGFTGTSMFELQNSQAMLQALRPLAKRFRKKIWIRRFPTKQATMDDIRACLEGLLRTENWKPGLIIIDYIDLVKPIRYREREYKEKEELLEAFRALCIEYHSVGWTATQTNRAGADARTVRMGHVKGSWDSLGICDYILTITATDELRLQNQVQIVFDKNRDGIAKVKIGPLETDWERMCFVKRTNATPEEILEGF